MPNVSYSANSPSRHLTNLDALRALAVCSVVIYHMYMHTGFQFPFLGTTGGLVGIQLFFIISGYLITESAQKHSFKAYWLHRFFRIFPAYWLAYISLGFLSNSQLSWAKITEAPGSFLLNLLNLQQVWAPALIEFSVLHVTWTLTVELFWYIIAPLVAIFLPKRALLCLVIALLISAGWNHLYQTHQLDPLFASGFAQLKPIYAESPNLPSQRGLIVNWAFPFQLIFFIMGACIYRYRETLLKTNNTVLIVLVIIFTLMLESFLHRVPGSLYLTGIGVSALFIIALKAPPLNSPTITRIGKVSYSIYLIHFPIIVLAFGRFGSMSRMLLSGIVLLIIFMVANLMYEFIERPSMRFARRFS